MMAARRSPWAWACSGLLVGALAGGLVYAPARWLAGALVWADAPVQLHNPSGTVWQGDAQLVLRSQAQEQTALPGRVRWNIRPAWQDRSPGLRMAWQADCCLDAPWVWHATGGLQDRAIGLFSDSLARKGFLGLGAKESLRFSEHASSFADFDRTEKIYQRRAA